MNKRYACALITGASSGLGEEYAIQLAPHVMEMVLVARRGDRLAQLAEGIRDDYPEVTVTTITADLSDSSERAALLENLQNQELVPDLLVNNAGLGDYGEFATAEWDKLEAMLRVNVEALTHLSHGLVPAMIECGRGAVINVSSLASLLPIPDFAVYAATKAYVTSFSEALRLELMDHGIPVLAVCPGPVHTGFGKVAQRGEGERQIPGREWFYVEKQQVVEDSLLALERNKARVFPHLKVAAAAFVLSAVPMLLLRGLMGMRPRR